MTSGYQTYIEQRSIPEPNTGCWLWERSIGSHGYGNAFNGKTVCVAHRLSYEAFKGPIPNEYDVDHLCRVKTCVNPDHLEATTKAANRRRQFGYRCEATVTNETCPHGHEYTRYSKKVLTCKTCQRIYRLSKKS